MGGDIEKDISRAKDRKNQTDDAKANQSINKSHLVINLVRQARWRDREKGGDEGI